MNHIDQMDLFIADILDVTPKGDMDTMETPLFALAKRPDTEVFRYEHGKHWVEVAPGPYGRPTIFDKDLLMYAISQVVEGKNRGRPISRRVKITAYDFLVTTHRDTSGGSYGVMMKSAQRLRGMTITTNLAPDGEYSERGFVWGLIDSVDVSRKKGSRVLNFELVLSEHLFGAIEDDRVLTYNQAYYRLGKPNERRLYELCRKFCGKQKIWEIGFEKLYRRFGSRAKEKEFRRSLRGMVADNNIPDYIIDFDDGRDVLSVFYKMGHACG